jgi:hypothetical protein
LNATLGLCSGCKNTIAKELFQILLECSILSPPLT